MTSFKILSQPKGYNLTLTKVVDLHSERKKSNPNTSLLKMEGSSATKFSKACLNKKALRL